MQSKTPNSGECSTEICKVRTVSFVIKEPIEQELDCLEASGITEKVTHIEWASPIVAVYPRKMEKSKSTMITRSQ